MIKNIVKLLLLAFVVASCSTALRKQRVSIDKIECVYTLGMIILLADDDAITAGPAVPITEEGCRCMVAIKGEQFFSLFPLGDDFCAKEEPRTKL